MVEEKGWRKKVGGEIGGNDKWWREKGAEKIVREKMILVRIGQPDWANLRWLTQQGPG
jgi:hypothetical protein